MSATGEIDDEAETPEQYANWLLNNTLRSNSEFEKQHVPSFDMRIWVLENDLSVETGREPRYGNCPFSTYENYKTRPNQEGDVMHVSGQMMDESADLVQYSVENSFYVMKTFDATTRREPWQLRAVKVLCTARFYKGKEIWEPFSYGNSRRDTDDVDTLWVMYPTASSSSVICPNTDTYEHHRNAVIASMGCVLYFKIYVFGASGGNAYVLSRAVVVNPWGAISYGNEPPSPAYQIRLVKHA
jgi:hypothetical protein